MWGNGGNNGGKPPNWTFTNNGAFSVNQTGGITAHTVNNYAPPERHMNEGFAESLRTNIPKGTKVVVQVTMNDAEAHQFGMEIQRFLIAEGHNINPDEFSQCMWSQPVRGHHLQKDKDGTIQVVIGTR